MSFYTELSGITEDSYHIIESTFSWKTKLPENGSIKSKIIGIPFLKAEW